MRVNKVARFPVSASGQLAERLPDPLCPRHVLIVPTERSPLADMIRATIRERGPVPFAWFMEQALYEPEHGYYSSGRCTIGRAGDYYTSVSVGPLFGRLLTTQFAEMWELLGRPRDFKIAEQGAHGGEFARDVLQAARTQHPEFFQALRYSIVEPFPLLRTRQAAALAGFEGQVKWSSSVAELPAFCGVHFSNELLDALPVHLVRWIGSAWCELYVGEKEGGFKFVEQPLSSESLVAHVKQIPLPLPVGYTTEVNFAALQWIEDVAQKLTAGFVVAVDYGYARDEFYASHRTAGTLRGFAAHRFIASPLEQIGEADITAHVEWTSVAEAAERCGFRVVGFTDQHHFITGLLAGVAGGASTATADAKTRRALQTLLHPQHLGMKFQFLCLSKNVSANDTLSGLRFAREHEERSSSQAFSGLEKCLSF